MPAKRGVPGQLQDKHQDPDEQIAPTAVAIIIKCTYQQARNMMTAGVFGVPEQNAKKSGKPPLTVRRGAVVAWKKAQG